MDKDKFLSNVVYTYDAVYDKKCYRYDSLDFVYYYDKEANKLSTEPVGNLSVLINRNSILDDLSYYDYIYNYKNSRIDNGHLILNDLPFTKPLSWFKSIKQAPMKVITSEMHLDYGLSISEDIPFGFIYHNNENNITYNAKKYGLKNTGEIDYDKLISEYTTINGTMIVKNKFLEEYNYITLIDGNMSMIMKQKDFQTSSLAISNIYFTNQPKIIAIGNKNDSEPSITRIRYDKYGIPDKYVKEFIKNDSLYYEENNVITSIHPLIYEPFCEELYKDIIFRYLTHGKRLIVTETYDKGDGTYIEYTRKVEIGGSI